MRFAAIQRLRAEYTVALLCRSLNVSTSGFHAWLSRPESARAREDRAIEAGMKKLSAKTGHSYGTRRHSRVFGCGRVRARRLMRKSGLVARKTQQFRACTTDSTHRKPVAENLLNQNFQVEKPNTVWVGDVTQLRTLEGKVYLAVLLDLHSRRVVGWATGRYLDSFLCLRAFDQAVASRRPKPGLIHHTDRGSEYASHVYQSRLREHRARCSMSRKGNCYDNAVAESFFDSLKTECWHRAFATRDQAIQEANLYIDNFYNTERLHSSLKYLTPEQFENRAA